MNILFVMIPIAILISIFFAIAFFWAVRDGQFDDLETPAHRIILDDLSERKETLDGNDPREPNLRR